jgi:hypothetical protein
MSKEFEKDELQLPSTPTEIVRDAMRQAIAMQIVRPFQTPPSQNYVETHKDIAPDIFLGQMTLSNCSTASSDSLIYIYERFGHYDLFDTYLLISTTDSRQYNLGHTEFLLHVNEETVPKGPYWFIGSPANFGVESMFIVFQLQTRCPGKWPRGDVIKNTIHEYQEELFPQRHACEELYEIPEILRHQGETEFLLYTRSIHNSQLLKSIAKAIRL